MSGIAGIFYRDQHRPVPSSTLESMSRRLVHRGPDAHGHWTGPGIGLIHRRLAVIDVRAGNQPLTNEDESISVVCNGTIANYRQLQQELVQSGHALRTASDAEVLVHLYEEDGERLVERLRGTFAFALWDSRRQSLLLGRDRVGVKPLYYYRDAEQLVFGSELKPILALPEVPREIDPEGLDDYFDFGFIPGALSIFRNIFKLEPGHVLRVDRENFRREPRRYWQLQFEFEERFGVDQWCRMIREKIDEAVQLHAEADVPVGAFLSSGLGAAVVARAASVDACGSLQTFSLGFRGNESDELPQARQLASYFGTQHNERVVTPDAVELLPRLIQSFDEPFADVNAIPTFLLADLAAEEVKVVLSGDGGDVAFAGHPRYLHDLGLARMRHLLPHWFRCSVVQGLAWMWPADERLPWPLRAKSLLKNLRLSPAQAYRNTIRLSDETLKQHLLSESLAGRLLYRHDQDRFAAVFRNAPRRDALAGMLAADLASVLPDQDLVRVDRAAMAKGLDVRTPLLDHELLELCARIPSKLKIRRRESKWIFRRAVEHDLPPGTLQKRRRGFRVPVDDWFRGELGDVFQDVVLRANSPIAQFVDHRVAERVLAAHRRGVSHGRVLWALLTFAYWAEEYRTPPRLEQTREDDFFLPDALVTDSTEPVATEPLDPGMLDEPPSAQPEPARPAQ